MFNKDIALLEESFKKYYFDHFDLIRVPNNPKEREFGYQKFSSGMIRHLSIKSDKELHLMLIQNIPSDVYCSNAYYSFPNSPMTEKDWKGADLIFDIDSKDLNMPCRQEHTCIICQSCNTVSKMQSTCPKCNSTKLDIKSLSCKNCIGAAKREVEKLCEILTKDLSVNPEEISIYFSGNEGFHIYANSTQYRNLGSRERTELVDYVMFRGAIPETFGMKKLNPQRSSFPEMDDAGWRGRFSEYIYGSKSKRSKAISGMITSGYSNLQTKLESMKDSIGVKIDPSVTMDIHRIFRLPGSLNSKSGLSKILCKEINEFNPENDACFLSDNPTEILANCPLEFRLKNKKFGPYNKERITLPQYSAVYMICKGLAHTT